MTTLRRFLLCLGLTLLGPSLAAADEKKEPPQRFRPVERLRERFTQLVPRDLEDKLKLTDEQKKQVAKLQQQLDDKHQKVMLNLLGEINNAQEALEKATKDNDLEGLKSLGMKVGVEMLDVRKTHQRLEEKLRALLTDEQKKVYDDYQKSRPGLGLRRSGDKAEEKKP